MYTRTRPSTFLRALALLIVCPLVALAALAPAPVSARVFPATGPARVASLPPDLSDVACPSTRVCYAVGYSGVQYDGVIYATGDGGRTWNRQNPGTRWGLRGIACPTVALCYSVGYAETTVMTTNGGRTWHDPHIPRSPQALMRVACPTTLSCIAAGNSPGGYVALVHRLLLTTDGARTWSYPSTPIDRTAYPINAVACPSANTCYAVGAGAMILASHDGGHTWQQQSNLTIGGNLPAPLTGVACMNERACVAVGGFPAAGMIMVTGDGGATWTNATLPTNAALSDVSCPAAGVCYAVGVGGTVLTTGDGGRDWTQMDSGTTHDLSAIACHGAGFCVVVGGSGFIMVLGHHQQVQPGPTRRGPASLTIPGTSIYYVINGSEYRSDDIPLQTPAYFAAFYTENNASTAVPTGRISIVKAGHTIFNGGMKPGTEPTGQTYLQAGIRFTSPALLGPLTARLTLKLGSATATTTVHFMVVSNGDLPGATPTVSAGQSAPQTISTAGAVSGGQGQGASER